MKTKTNFLTKLLAVFAVVFLCLGVATLSLTGQPKSVTAETDEKYNMYCVYDRYAGNKDFYGVNETGSSTASNFKITDEMIDNGDHETSDGYILKLTCNESIASTALRCNITFIKGVKYTISFKAKCETYTTNSTWNIWPRVYVNNVNTNYETQNDKVKGDLKSWETRSWEFTPNNDSTSGSNLLDLIVTMNVGDVVLLSDIRVEFSATHFNDKKDIIANSELTYAPDRAGVDFNSSNKEYTVTAKNTFSSLNGLLKFNTYEWIEGATYEVLFRIKTSDDSKFTISSVQAKVPGKNDTVVIQSTNLLSAPGGTVHSILDWKTVYVKFSYSDKFTTADQNAKTDNIYFLITNANEGDICYIKDMHVYANVSTVTVSDNGKNTNENVVTGSEYTLPSATEVNGKAFVGWDVNGTLYQAGDKITVSVDTTVTSVLVDFATDSGAYLRLSVEDPGIRFTATANKTAIENALTKYGTVTEFGMRITADKVSGYLDIETNLWKSDGTSFVSAVTGFGEDTEEFYDVKFTATAYLKLQLENNEVITVFANSTSAEKSIVDMAKAAYSDRNATATDDYTNYVETDANDASLSGKYSKFDADELAIIWTLASLTADNSANA